MPHIPSRASSWGLGTEPADDWRELAACREVDPEMFFPDDSDISGIQRAKAICDRCEVSTRCLAAAYELGAVYGIWGGRTPQERKTSSPDRAPCGTVRAFYQHRRRGEPVDDACRRARNVSAQQGRARRREQVIAEIVALVARQPGLCTAEIVKRMRRGRETVTDALRVAIKDGRLVARRDGSRRLHYPGRGA